MQLSWYKVGSGTYVYIHMAVWYMGFFEGVT